MQVKCLQLKKWLLFSFKAQGFIEPPIVGNDATHRNPKGVPDRFG